MLMAFLSSEGVKNYKANYSWMLYGLGVGQIIRIFILPRMAHNAVVKVSNAETLVMGNAQFIRCIVYLLVSAGCLIAAAYINQSKSKALADYEQALSAKRAKEAA